MARNFMAWLHGHYGRYLAAQGTDGGFCDEWVTCAIADAVREPETSGWDKAGRELLAKACRGVWHDDPAPEQPDLFSVGGVEILPTYTFPDPDPAVIGGYRRVIARWATTRQVTLDAMVTKTKADEAQIAAARKSRDAAQLAARIGDPDALLWDFRD